MRKSELVTGSAMGNLGQKISLGDVASDQSFKKPERHEREVGTSGMRGLRVLISSILLWSISMT